MWSLSVSSLKTECTIFPEEANLKTLKFGNKGNIYVSLRNVFVTYILKVPGNPNTKSNVSWRAMICHYTVQAKKQMRYHVSNHQILKNKNKNKTTWLPEHIV